MGDKVVNVLHETQIEPSKTYRTDLIDKAYIGIIEIPADVRPYVHNRSCVAPVL